MGLLDVIKLDANSFIFPQFWIWKPFIPCSDGMELGLMNQDLAIPFSLSGEKMSKIFRKWIKSLSVLWKNLSKYPIKKQLEKNIQFSFNSFKTCLWIIDIKEILFEWPQNQLARAQMYSNFKYHNIVKCLTEIMQAVAVSFFVLWVGWTDDDYQNEWCDSRHTQYLSFLFLTHKAVSLYFIYFYFEGWISFFVYLARNILSMLILTYPSILAVNIEGTFGWGKWHCLPQAKQ